MKIRLVEAELFHADRQMDGRIGMTKLIVAFRNFSNASKKRGHKLIQSHRGTIHFVPTWRKAGFTRLSGTIKRGFQGLKESLMQRGKENGFVRSRRVLISLKVCLQ
jgi:hypothetical protein